MFKKKPKVCSYINTEEMLANKDYKGCNHIPKYKVKFDTSPDLYFCRDHFLERIELMTSFDIFEAKNI